jgi:hypothetical protein
MEDNVEVSKNLENVEELVMPDFAATVRVEEAEEENNKIEVDFPILPMAEGLYDTFQSQRTTKEQGMMNQSMQSAGSDYSMLSVVRN